MSRILVLYKSSYGYTKIYAEMIAAELGCDIREVSDVPADGLEDYDTVIYGGGLYAGNINGIARIKQDFDKLQTKNTVVWATGFCSGSPEEMQKVWKHNFPDYMLEKIHTFYLRGGFDYQKLSVVHKLMMNGLKLKIKADKNRSEEDEQLLKAYDTPENHCDKENITELITYVKSLFHEF